MEHLDELRRRLWICLAAVVLGSVISFAFVERIIGWLKAPAGPFLPRLAFFSPTEAVVAYLKVAVASGLVLAMPVILYEVWAFVKAGLTWRECAFGRSFVWWGSVLFGLGAACAYWVILPVSLRFLLGFGSLHLEPVLSISRYLSFVTGIMLLCGALFELPLVVLLLSRLGIVTPDTLRRRRAVALLVILIVAAVVSPTTDVVNLIIMTIPMLGLYELSVFVSRLSV